MKLYLTSTIRLSMTLLGQTPLHRCQGKINRHMIRNLRKLLLHDCASRHPPCGSRHCGGQCVLISCSLSLSLRLFHLPQITHQMKCRNLHTRSHAACGHVLDDRLQHALGCCRAPAGRRRNSLAKFLDSVGPHGCLGCPLEQEVILTQAGLLVTKRSHQ